MRKNNTPTENQLKDLYDAASAFKQRQPWKWLYDGDLICVENPKDDSLGYCSVMGRAEEQFALGVYLGSKGFWGFCQLMEHGNDLSHHQILHFQDCLLCSFEDRDVLTNEDRKQIKELGLSFRGKNAWPMFRRYEPGYNPWFINEDECVFLTHALKQTLFVADKILAGQLEMDMENGISILRYSTQKDNTLQWHSKKVQVPYPVIEYSPVEITDDVLLQRIKKAGRMGEITLEADTCYMPTAVQESKGERPYFPRVFILADQKTGLIIDYELYDCIDDDANVTLHKLIDVCLEEGIPQEIHIRSEPMSAILADFCKKTGIHLKTVKRLSAVDRMIEEMK